MSSSFLSGSSSSETLASITNPGCEEPFPGLPLFSLEDTFLSQPLDLDNFYQPRLSPTSAVVPSMYGSTSTPSPPPTAAVPSAAPPSTPIASTPSTNNPATRKKRKKDASPAPDEPNAGFDWQTYASPAADHSIFSAAGQTLTDQFELSMQKIEANTHYSVPDNAWICYRQNQFKVICSLKSPQIEGSFYIQDSGAPVAISQFCAKLYAIKEINSAVGEEMRVGLHHVGKSRVKKEKLDINIAPFTNGRVEFSNVQFERSNAVKGQQLEYFHLVVAFYAKSFTNAYYHIFSRISMRLIVRSQNPGFYGDSPVNAQVEHEDTGSNRSGGNSPNRDTDSSPASSHESLSPLPSYNPQPTPTLQPTTPAPNNMLYSFSNPPNPNLGGDVKFGGEFMSGAGQLNPQPATPPAFHFQQQQPISQPPPFMPTMVSNNSANVNTNVNNVNSPILRLNSTNINTTTTDIYYNNNNPNNPNNPNNMNANMSNNSGFMSPNMSTFGRDAQTTNVGIGSGAGPWKSEPSSSNSAPGPSRAPGGGGAPGGPGGNGSGDGNRGGGMGEPAWQQFSDVVVHHGKVGINTFTPLEALTVNGNILVTGNVYKPSDKRIKSDITEVDSSTQLSNVRNLKIYDYVVRSQQERGVLAQELQAIMPHAVNNVGTVDNVPNFLVINERVLLFENIGATQQLDKELETEKQTIVEIDSRVAELKETTTKENLEVKNKIGNLFDVLFAEENGDKMMLAGLEEEYLNIGFSVFKMGPPRSFFLVGFLFPYSWSLGALYVFSNISSRRVMGYSNLLMLISFFVLYFCTEFYMIDDNILTKVRVVWLGVGILLLLITYGRMRAKLKKKIKQNAKERGKTKQGSTSKSGKVSKKNLQTTEQLGEKKKKKKKEKAVVIDVTETIVVTHDTTTTEKEDKEEEDKVAKAERMVEIVEKIEKGEKDGKYDDEAKAKVHFRGKEPMKEVLEIEEALRARELSA